MSTAQIIMLFLCVAAFCLFLWISCPPQLSSRGRWWFGLAMFYIGFWSVVAAGVACIA